MYTQFDQLGQEVVRYQRRKATCIAVEDTDMLIIDQETAQMLIQPDQRMSLSISMEDPNTAKLNPDKQQNIDNLNMNIKFLQTISFFQDVDAATLTPIALNVKLKEFKYGEYITKQNEIPENMIIIVSGLCRAMLSRIDSNTYYDTAEKHRPIWTHSMSHPYISIQQQDKNEQQQEKERFEHMQR